MRGIPFDQMTREELENELKMYSMLGSPHDIAALFRFSETLVERFEAIGTDSVEVAQLIQKLDALGLKGRRKHFLKKAIQLLEVYGTEVDVKLFAYDRLTKRRRNYRNSVLVLLKNLREDCSDEWTKKIDKIIYDLENI